MTDGVFYFDKLKKLYEKLDKLLSCSDRDCGNCVDCCLNVYNTFMFLPLYIDYINHNISSGNDYPLLTWEEAYELSLCPYLDLKEKKCGIYELRPVVCRLFPRLSEIRETSLYHRCAFYEDYELSGLEGLPFIKEIEEVYMAISALNLSYIKKNNPARVREYRFFLENPLNPERRLEKDMDIYVKAIIADPFLPALHYNIARVYMEFGDREGAKREIETALGIDGGDYRAIFLRAGIFEMENRREEAAEEIKKAIALNPRNLTAHYNLGMIYLMDEKYSEAGYYFKKLISLSAGAFSRFKKLREFMELCEKK